ncbi:cytochrome b [Tropicimonas sp. IMCC6043]|uniref:cytochrome b n=1 Tax=Tropicimonas sp. IMCC6043 TaxID=2510645 RepID=UPI00101C35EE|nr:cytochrome b/b6 domain-containing protein [Tropicimonas sp. IMCC6043]RYH07953.1 cytochrome b [Tropicimonas sp. IMCC6043]
MSDSATQFRRPARLLHWGMAVLVLATIPAGLVMVQPDLNRTLQNTLFLFHKNVGVLLFFLVLLRAFYRWRHPPAALPADLPDWQRKIAGLSHRLLYALLVIMPLAGYVRVKAGGFPLESLDWLGVPSLVPRSDALAAVAKNIHFLGGFAIAGLIALHIAAAAYHGIWRRDGVFSRMWPPFAGRGD